MYDPDSKEQMTVLCDVCRAEIGPKTPFVNLGLQTLWGGPVRQGMSICAKCIKRCLTNVQPESALYNPYEDIDRTTQPEWREAMLKNDLAKASKERAENPASEAFDVVQDPNDQSLSAWDAPQDSAAKVVGGDSDGDPCVI